METLDHLQPVSPAIESAATTEGGPRRHGPAFFWPLRTLNFRRLIGGQTVSRFGDQFYFIAIPWLVLRSTSAPIALAAVLGSASVTLGLFTLVGGVLADRYGPRKMMLYSDVVRFFLVAGLAAIAILSVPPLWLLATISALIGIAAGLFYPASSAMIPYLVAGDELQAANSFDQLTMQSSNFLGPSIAGVVLSVSRLALGFVVDAATFAVSVLTLFAIRMPARAATATPSNGGAILENTKPQGGLAAMFEALGFMRKTQFLPTLVGISLTLNFAVNGLFDVALPLLLKHWVGLDSGPRAMGFVIGGFGLGSILGAIAAGVASKLRQKSLVSILCLLPVAGLVAWMPFVGSTYLLAALFAVVGVFIGVSNVLIITVVQKLIPLEMMGRMMSILMLGSFVATPLSTLAYGIAASIVPDISWLFLAGAALFGIGSVVALLNRHIWQAI